jgi:hypothetical protein
MLKQQSTGVLHRVKESKLITIVIITLDFCISVGNMILVDTFNATLLRARFGFVRYI